MEVNKALWWDHNSKLGKYSSAKVHRSIKIKLNDDDKIPNSIDDYTITVEQLEGLSVKEYDGLCASEFLLLSGIQHFEFYERQWALVFIHSPRRRVLQLSPT